MTQDWGVLRIEISVIHWGLPLPQAPCALFLVLTETPRAFVLRGSCENLGDPSNLAVQCLMEPGSAWVQSPQPHLLSTEVKKPMSSVIHLGALRQAWSWQGGSSSTQVETSFSLKVVQSAMSVELLSLWRAAGVCPVCSIKWIYAEDPAWEVVATQRLVCSLPVP